MEYSKLHLAKAVNEHHMLNMCSYVNSLLAKLDMFCSKKCSHNLLGKLKMCSARNIL